MTTLLVLGSKPDPVLPRLDDIGEVACANDPALAAHQHDCGAASAVAIAGVAR